MSVNLEKKQKKLTSFFVDPTTKKKAYVQYSLDKKFLPYVKLFNNFFYSNKYYQKEKENQLIKKNEIRIFATDKHFIEKGGKKKLCLFSFEKKMFLKKKKNQPSFSSTSKYKQKFIEFLTTFFISKNKMGLHKDWYLTTLNQQNTKKLKDKKPTLFISKITKTKSKFIFNVFNKNTNFGFNSFNEKQAGIRASVSLVASFQKNKNFLKNRHPSNDIFSVAGSKEPLKPVNYILQRYQRSNQETCLDERPSVLVGEWVQKGDFLSDCANSVLGELALGKNILVAYMPWEGFNFEDAIVVSNRLIYEHLYTSLHIERYEIEICETSYGLEQITNQVYELVSPENSKIGSKKNFLKENQKVKKNKRYGLVQKNSVQHLDENGLIQIGFWVKSGDVLVGKITPLPVRQLSPQEKFFYSILGKEPPLNRDTSLRVPTGVQGRILGVTILDTENMRVNRGLSGPGKVQIYIAVKRVLQVGDKMAGRHGNKGIVSTILSREDMPYLPDGTPVDMVLNPLGVPSRMNVGQVFECLLGLAGSHLKQQYKITPFDEIYGTEASRSLVYSKLYEARCKTGQEWLFQPDFPGKTRLFDGRTGECFHQASTVGLAYMLKLIHLVDKKIHARATGPYSLITQQPLRGRSKHGGQRLGEMEVWAIEGFGAAYSLQELMTLKSDDTKGRYLVFEAILENKPISVGTPESFRVLMSELQALCIFTEVRGSLPNQETKNFL